MKYDKVIRDLARTQHQVVARRQLTAAGVDYRAINNRIRSGYLEPVTDRVLRLNGAPASSAQNLMITLLHVGPDTYLSHTTAAAWWGISGFRIEPIHVAMERVYRVRNVGLPVVVHHSTVIPEWCRKLHIGVPVVSPGLAIYQLAAILGPDRVAKAMDNAWSLRLMDGRVVDDLILRLGQHGRDGTVLMRKLRKARPDPWIPPASNLESRFDQIAGANGFSFRRQVDVGGEDWSGRVDFLADDCPLIVEILSERYHTSLTDREADAERRKRQTELGFVVVEVWDHEIFHTPWLIIERIRKARESLLIGSTRLDRHD
ncbi:MAG: type IV toxin-antitoxin system AbiEi family antitoxin domain-containing protein [Actinobacteria bacterium]|nr:type IV toxin-antitoxin system AbiEi family antitoxin domain-containing protein [Actinomycetota bacterium]